MNNKQKNSKKAALSLAALVAVIAVLLCVYWFTKENTQEGAKAVTIEVVHKDKTTNTFEVNTDREYLGEVLQDENLVEGEMGDYGLFITSVDGEAADSANEEWWCITKGGGQLNSSADQTPIADGEKYELTLMIGY